MDLFQTEKKKYDACCFLNCLCISCFACFENELNQFQCIKFNFGCRSLVCCCNIPNLDDDPGWTWDNTIPYMPNLDRVFVIKVYDGDTITVCSQIDATVYRWSVRIRGIDAPELKSKNEHEKSLAVAAQKALSDRILNKWVNLKNVGNEKYGRILADVYQKDCNLGEWMLQQGHVVRYDGGTKNAPWIIETV